MVHNLWITPLHGYVDLGHSTWTKFVSKCRTALGHERNRVLHLDTELSMSKCSTALGHRAWNVQVQYCTWKRTQSAWTETGLLRNKNK